MVVAGSGSQQMTPAAVVWLDGRHTMAFLSLVERQTQGLDMDQAFNTLGFRELEKVLTLTIPKQ